MAKVLENSKVLQDYRKSLHQRITLHKTLDQEARRAQVFSTGYTLGDSHKHTEHGYRVSQSGASSTLSPINRLYIFHIRFIDLTTRRTSSYKSDRSFLIVHFQGKLGKFVLSFEFYFPFCDRSFLTRREKRAWCVGNYMAVITKRLDPLYGGCHRSRRATPRRIDD